MALVKPLKALATDLGISVGALYVRLHRRSGVPPLVRIGGRWYYSPVQFDKWIQNGGDLS